MTKTYVIADLHGRFDLLDEAMMLISETHQDGEKVILLGDYIDRGPDSAMIIHALMTCQKENPDLICLMGNHEAMMLEVLANPTQPKLNWWIGNGGGATLLSYGHPNKLPFEPGHVPQEHLDWLTQLPLYHADKHRVYVHASIEHSVALEDQDEHTLLWGIYRKTNENYEGWHRLDNYGPSKHVVHGHEQHNDVVLLPGRTDLDTFAWNTGRLAIGIFDDGVPGGPVEIKYVQGRTAEELSEAA